MIFVENLSVFYEKGKPILRNVSFSIEKNGIFSILGRNGSGKTTLLYVLSGIIPEFIEAYMEGEVKVFGSIPSKFKSKFFIFQDVEDSFISHTVKEEVSPYGKESIRALELVGLADKFNSDVFSLSHGEKHRLALAVAIAMKPKLLLFDESFASLDYASLKLIIPILKDLSKNSIILFSTHSTQLAYEISDDVFLFSSTKILRGKSLLKDAEKYGLRRLCKNKIYM